MRIQFNAAHRGLTHRLYRRALVSIPFCIYNTGGRSACDLHWQERAAYLCRDRILGWHYAVGIFLRAYSRGNGWSRHGNQHPGIHAGCADRDSPALDNPTYPPGKKKGAFHQAALKTAYLIAFGLILHDVPEGFAMARRYHNTHLFILGAIISVFVYVLLAAVVPD